MKKTAMIESAWNSEEPVTLWYTGNNGFTDFYACKLRSLAMLCTMLDGEDLVKEYRVVLKKDDKRLCPADLNFSDTYKKWRW